MKILILFLILIFVVNSGLSQEVALNTIPVKEASKSIVKPEKSSAIATSFAYSYKVGEEEICALSKRTKGNSYRIQFNVADGFKKMPDNMTNLTVYGEVYPEYIFEKNITRFLLGDFKIKADAEYFLSKLWEMGYEHSFILPYVDGFRVAD